MAQTGMNTDNYLYLAVSRSLDTGQKSFLIFSKEKIAIAAALFLAGQPDGGNIPS
jgi:hypothetical protein